jgi:hypothetical protein
MNFIYLLEKFITEISKYIEDNDILEILLEKIDKIKDKKIEQINSILYEIILNFEFNKNIFSEQEINYIKKYRNLKGIYYLLQTPLYESIFFLNKYLRDKRINISDSLLVYSIYLHISNEKNKKSVTPKIDNLSYKNRAVYLDYNILHKYLKYEKIITDFLKIENLFLVYSPIHAEEIIRITNQEEKENQIEINNKNIEKFFYNRKVLNNQDYIEIEEFILSVRRAKNNPIGKINDVIKIFEFYSPKGIFLLLKAEIFLYFEKLDIHYGDLNNITLKNIFESHPFLEEKLLQCLSCSKLNSKIYNTFRFLDIIGYHLDKKIRGVRSSFYDCLHLEYAEGTRYFITTDKKLAWRAEGIFNFLNIKTGVYLLNENKLKRIKEYSDKDI